MKRKGLLAKLAVIGACAVFASAAMVGCSGQQAADTSGTDAGEQTASNDLLPCTIGYWGGTCEAPIMIAEANGYFEQCGLDCTVMQITSGTAELIANDDLQFFEATPNFLPSIYNGMKIKLVDNIHTGCIQGVARPESGITSYKDLVGKKVGMYSEGDMAQLFIQAEMGRDGIDYRQTEWIAYSDGGASMAFKALQDGSIDALTWFDPYGELGAMAGYTKFFNNATDEIYADNTCCYLAATDAIIARSPETVTRMCKAMQMASDFLNEHPAEAARIIQDSGYVAESDTILEAYGIPTEGVDLHENLLASYTWCAGDKAMYDRSADENWEILYYGSDILTDAPEGGPESAEWADYIAGLNAKTYQYFGAE